MKRIVSLLLICAAGLIVACGANRGTLSGKSLAEAQIPPLSGALVTAASVELRDLSENPESYAGEYVLVSGFAHPVNFPACASKPVNSPVQWQLSDDEGSIALALPGTPFGASISDGIFITVTGTWQLWKGPVGCGREAEQNEIWYLHADRITSPDSIALVPSVEAGQISLPAQPSGTLEGATESLPVAGTPTPFLAPTSTASVIVPDSSAPQGAVTTGTAAGQTSTPGATSTETVTGLSQISTPVNGTSGTPVAGYPAPSVTAEGTMAPGGTSATVIDQEELTVGSLEDRLLEPEVIHRWPFTVSESELITVSVASEFALDVALTVRDPSGQVIAQQNLARDGEPEIVPQVNLAQPGTYDILVESASGAPGYYAILVYSETSYPFIFLGTLQMDVAQEALIQPESDHFWHFSGAAGQTIAIIATPNDDSDLFMTLYGPDDSVLVEMMNRTVAGEVELLEITLPEDGFYSIRVGEFAFLAADYQIVLNTG